MKKQNERVDYFYSYGFQDVLKNVENKLCLSCRNFENGKCRSGFDNPGNEKCGSYELYLRCKNILINACDNLIKELQ